MEWVEKPNTNEYEPQSCVVQICKTRSKPCGLFICTGEKFCGINY